MIRPAELTEAALAASKADGCIVLLTDTSEANLRWANNTMTTNGHTTTRSFSVISVVEGAGRSAVGPSIGTVRGNGVDLDEVRAVVAASEEAARQSGPARDAAPLVEGPADGDFDAPAAATEIGVFARLADELATAFGDSRGRIAGSAGGGRIAGSAGGGQLLYGFAQHRLDTTWLASSTGLRRRWVQPTGTVEINGKVADDLTRSAWAAAYTADFTDLDLTALAAEVRRRLSWSQRRLELPAGRYETILPPAAVADLMIDLASSMEGRPAHEGRSPWTAPAGSSSPTRLGERLTNLPLMLSSDPAAPGLTTAPFLATSFSSDSVSVFDNGSPARRVDWLRDGTVNALAYPRAAAAELGGQFTPPPENLVLTGGSSASTDDLVARTERGLLLTCLWYIREVDPTSLLLTGLTRDGVYLIEDGEVVGQVNNFRFNESPIDLLHRASEVGATEGTLCRESKDWFVRTSMPPVRVPDFNMSSVSQAS
ncbi:MAG TPA: metallopeptidase TldD-related protein [Pseudonocardiaceae bacterium]|nr:metallopeptidase TldD-related protein [Pseudonocardiaceae bacterium]